MMINIGATLACACTTCHFADTLIYIYTHGDFRKYGKLFFFEVKLPFTVNFYFLYTSE